MKEMRVMRGLPGSGKSTESSVLAAQGYARVCKDDIRKMLRVLSGADESLVHQIHVEAIRSALTKGRNVVADCTHIVERDIDVYRKLAAQYGDVRLTTQTMRTPPDVCIQRDSGRTGTERVGESVIMGMWKRSGWAAGWPADVVEVYPPRFERLSPTRDPSLPDAFICDLDGTAMIIGDRSPYDASRCDETDEPCLAVQRVTQSLVASGVTGLFVSGRSDAFRAQTERSLQKHYSHAAPHALFMRRAGDSRRDDAVKADIYAEHICGKYNVLLVLDDRGSVVRFWRSVGLTVMQLDDREF